MKRLFVLILLLAAAVPVRAGSPDRGRLGIGVVLGAPTGFSMKYWESQRIAYQGSIGGMFNGGLMIGGDYLIHERVFRNQEVPFYYGPGIFLGDAGFGGPDYAHNRLALGVRCAFGVDFVPRQYPFDISAELGPALLLTPTVGVGVQLSVAFRFYP